MPLETDEVREAGEHNAVAWLSLTDRELIERSASLGLPGNLHPDPSEPSGVEPTPDQIVEARKTADDFAREHAGNEFVDRWIEENRENK